MDMSLTNCWDCPVTLGSVIGYLIGIAAAVAFSLWLLSLRFLVVRILGVFMVVVSCLLALGLTFTVPRWGIINPFAEGFAGFQRGTAYTIYIAFDLAILGALVWWSAFRTRRKVEPPARTT
ncbi:MAG TPA: hypothetical protein VN380_05570 [Thermoanaerobaculia bacterium]|jgi:hypothetical protein|nr:hypothetical protein [Thermoanaerobaculia bacterium]